MTLHLEKAVTEVWHTAACENEGGHSTCPGCMILLTLATYENLKTAAIAALDKLEECFEGDSSEANDLRHALAEDEQAEEVTT